MDDSIRMHAQILVVENVHFHFSSGPIWTPGAPPIWAETGLIHQLRQRGLEQWVTEQQSEKTRQKARKRKAGREESRNAEKGRNAVIFQGVSVRLTPQQPNHKQALSDSQPMQTWGSRSPGLKSQPAVNQCLCSCQQSPHADPKAAPMESVYKQLTDRLVHSSEWRTFTVLKMFLSASYDCSLKRRLQSL